jgi:polar amino acid transport system permease protein
VSTTADAGAAAPEGTPPARCARPLPPRAEQVSARDRWLPIGIAVATTVVVFGAVGGVITASPTWPVIRDQFFDVAEMRAALPQVWAGFLVNMRIWAVSLVLIALAGLGVAILRSLPGPWMAPVRVAAVVYVDLLRGMPALLLVLLFGLGVPALDIPGLPSGRLFWGTTALVLGYAAYTSDVYRAGMQAVHDGQRAAAKALGLTEWQILRHAIIPQAVRNVTPALLNLAVALQKDVALLSVIGVREAVREAQIYTSRTFNFSSMVVATLLFLVATVPLARFTDRMARRDQERRLQRTR